MDTDRLRSSDPLVAAVLAAAAAPAEAPLPGEAAALAVFRQIHQPSRRERVVQGLVRAKVAALAVAGGVVLASGVATAATGTLPGVSSVIGPAHSHGHGSGGHSPTGTTSPTGTVSSPGSQGTTDTGAPHPADSTGKGGAVVPLATNPATSGVDKGQAVCTYASDARCRVGQTGAPTTGPHATHPTPRATPTHPAATGATHRRTPTRPAVTPPAR
jgi:hypothetical protein